MFITFIHFFILTYFPKISVSQMGGIIFDALSGERPTRMFGNLKSQSETQEVIENFEKYSIEIIKNIELSFKERFFLNEVGIEILDKIIKRMWQDNWSPKHNNLNMFVTHFGILLFLSIKNVVKCKIICRSKIKMDHISIWIKEKKIEYFPIHKIFKAMTNPEGESLLYFLNCIKSDLV